jgi:hypothetical protein
MHAGVRVKNQVRAAGVYKMLLGWEALRAIRRNRALRAGGRLNVGGPRRHPGVVQLQETPGPTILRVGGRRGIVGPLQWQ